MKNVLFSLRLPQLRKEQVESVNVGGTHNVIKGDYSTASTSPSTPPIKCPFRSFLG